MFAAKLRSLQRALAAASLRSLDWQSFACDFGGTSRRRPLAVVAVTNEDEIVRALRLARALDLPVAVRGAGHSTGAQTLSEGIVLALSAGRTAFEVSQDGRCRVFAGARWLAVEAELNRVGRSVPVLTDYLDLSVGGTLSVGGYGMRSIARGSQVDHVRSFDIVLPDGTCRTCTPTIEPELFRCALAGLTPVGVISRVEFESAPLPETCERYTVEHRDFAELGRLLVQVAATDCRTIDAFCAVCEPADIRPRSLWITDRRVADPAPTWPLHPALETVALRSREIVREPRLATHDKRCRLLGQFPDHFHIWQDFVIDATRWENFSHHIDDLVHSEERPWIYVLGIRKRSHHLSFPFEAASGASDRLYVGVGVYHFLSRSRQERVRPIQEQLNRLVDTCIALGGRPYRYGSCMPPPNIQRSIYGRDYDELVSLKKNSDPNGRFHPLVATVYT